MRNPWRAFRRVDAIVMTKSWAACGMVQATVGQKLLKYNKIKSFNLCLKLSSGHCPSKYKRITTTTSPYVILITNPPNKLYTHLS